jgi:L-2-hydroxycarboxylate dehydrogenase (NAD+)
VPNSGAGAGLLVERRALEEHEFNRADVLVEAELGLIVAALAPDIRSTPDAEFVRNSGDVIIAIDPASALELVRRRSGYPDLVRAAPPMQAGAPVGSPGDGAARRRAEAFENGFEIEPRLWRELNGLAQSNSSVARGYSL